ncbi:hypothetical protein N181_28750 [Sinorhizobium fredii USDA 205]|nr:hypothetical protein N181_28750 [Sinorhizobium fredii USDA 205]
MLGVLTPAFDMVGESLDALSGDRLSQTLKVSAEPSLPAAGWCRISSNFRKSTRIST